MAAHKRSPTAQYHGEVPFQTERLEQPRVARPEGVRRAMRAALSSCEKPWAARSSRARHATAGDKKPH
jgi:hypothetical protein